MYSLSNEGYTTATDFADYLVQNNNLSFRDAYKISAIQYANAGTLTAAACSGYFLIIFIMIFMRA